MLQNFGELVKECKKHLRAYLEEKGIKTTNKLFRCPNKAEHNNQDSKPSANFCPDTNSWHCFSCTTFKQKLGDIFDAVSLLEKKDIKGENFIMVVKYLCNKYKIPYKETVTKEEQFLKEVSAYLTKLVDYAHTNLNNKLKDTPKLKQFLEEKQWTASISTFQLGYMDEIYCVEVTDKDILAYLNLDTKNLVNRVIIPIKNVSGTIVGITSRSLAAGKDTATIKYIHSIAYNLSKLVFNIDAIDYTKEVILVEGPSSVITLNSFKITNATATFGNDTNTEQYSLLVKRGVKKLLFLYDNDAGGKEGLRNSLECLCKGGMETRIGFLSEEMDPGEYVIKHKTLSNITSISLYSYLLETYAANTTDKIIEKCLMQYVNNLKDIVGQEKLINEVAKKIKINKSTIIDLLNAYKKGSNTNIKEILHERGALVQTLTDFEKWSWSRGTLLGLKSFESFDKKLDGIQNGLILFGGKPGAGKSATLITLAQKLLQYNENKVHLLYFTIDDSIFVTLSRIIANLSGIPINVVSNPNYRIAKANIPDHVKQDYINRREKAMTFLRNSSSFFSLKDGEEGSTIEMIQEKVKTIAPLTEGKQLVVFIDNLHNLRSNKFVSDRHLYSLISQVLNSIANKYNCPVIASTHITKEAIKNKQYDGNAIKETGDFYYDSKLIIFVDTDDAELENSRDDIEIKVIVSKSKFSAYTGVIPMTFYRSLSKVQEITSKDKEQKLFK